MTLVAYLRSTKQNPFQQIHNLKCMYCCNCYLHVYEWNKVFWFIILLSLLELFYFWWKVYNHEQRLHVWQTKQRKNLTMFSSFKLNHLAVLRGRCFKLLCLSFPCTDIEILFWLNSSSDDYFLLLATISLKVSKIWCSSLPVQRMLNNAFFFALSVFKKLFSHCMWLQ